MSRLGSVHTVHTIHADAVAAQPWRNGGGQTRELLVWPTHLDHPYRQNWQLRISRADIASNGPFSRFDGVERWFVVLSGQGVLLHPCPRPMAPRKTCGYCRVTRRCALTAPWHPAAP